MVDFKRDKNILEMRLIHEIPKNAMSQNEGRFQAHEVYSNFAQAFQYTHTHMRKYFWISNVNRSPFPYEFNEICSRFHFNSRQHLFRLTRHLNSWVFHWFIYQLDLDCCLSSYSKLVHFRTPTFFSIHFYNSFVNTFRCAFLIQLKRVKSVPFRFNLDRHSN